MKTWAALLAGLALSAAAPAADRVRLELWVTDPIGPSSGAQCHLPASPTTAPSLPTSVPTLTEHDVIAWNPEQGRWTLDPSRFSGSEAARKLQDRCFVLAIDGQPVTSGVVLSSHSARLTRIPTLALSTRKGSLELRLTSGLGGSQAPLLHVDALDAVLARRTDAQP